jgi:hypothetical protein
LNENERGKREREYNGIRIRIGNDVNYVSGVLRSTIMETMVLRLSSRLVICHLGSMGLKSLLESLGATFL